MATSRQPGRHQLATTVQPRIIPVDNVFCVVDHEYPDVTIYAWTCAIRSTTVLMFYWSGHLVQWKAPAQARQPAIKVFTMWTGDSRGSLLAESRVYPIRKILLASWTFRFPIFR